jgi:hypothetical protein
MQLQALPVRALEPALAATFQASFAFGARLSFARPLLCTRVGAAADARVPIAQTRLASPGQRLANPAGCAAGNFAMTRRVLVARAPYRRPRVQLGLDRVHLVERSATTLQQSLVGQLCEPLSQEPRQTLTRRIRKGL